MKRISRSTYFKWGATVLIVGALLVLFYHMVTNYKGFRSEISSFVSIISPFLYGFVMAYLLGPIYNYIVRKCYPALKGDAKTNKRALTISKVIATVICLVVIIGIVAGMVALLLPQIIESISVVSQSLPANLDHASELLDNLLANFENTQVTETIQAGMDELQKNLVTWVQNTLLPGVGSVMQRISSGVIVTIKTSLNLIIGLIACAYFLNGKEKFVAQIKMIIKAFLKPEHAEEVLELAAYTNRTFGGFITGKIIDSAIIGILCFVAMSVLKLPYPLLISTIVGITNIIPFFGPFIGAIPSIAIIILISPIQALWFLILIIVLQQLDGNVIGPAILGNSIGIASFWVMFAIIIGGGMFGFLGMILGVPVFAVIYYYFGKYITKRLVKKCESNDIRDYMSYDKYEMTEEDVRTIELEEKKQADNKVSIIDRIKGKKDEGTN